MRLRVIHRAGAKYRGQRYAHGETFDVDPTAHNVAAEVRYLTALGKVEEVEAKPLGRVSSTRPAAATTAADEGAREVAPAKAEDGATGSPSRSPSRRAGYSRRDLRAED